MTTDSRIVKLRVGLNHPDFSAAQHQSIEARRLHNTLNYIARKIYEQRAYNREYNKSVTDKRRLIKNPHTKLDNLFNDPVLLEMGVVSWLKKNKSATFTHQHAFAPLIKILYNYLNLDLNSKVAQKVGASLSRGYKSYRALRKLFFENPGANQSPSLPGYKKTYGYVEYTLQALSNGQRPLAVREGTTQVIPTGWKTGFELPAGVTLANVSSARLTPLHDKAFELEVVYETSIPDPAYDLDDPIRGFRRELKLAKRRAQNEPLAAAIDLGQDVLAAVVFSDGRSPVLVSGKPVKSINRHTNKQNAKLKSVHDVERNNIYENMKRRAYQEETDYPQKPYPIPSARLSRIWQKRTDRIDNYLHTASSRVISMLSDAGVKLLVIGWNAGFKDSINLGKINNQKFVQIPHARFRDQLIYKGKAVGITVVVVDESYTSKTSFLDGDEIPTWGLKPKKWKPSGKRMSRGMYKSAAGILIHADVNAAYNILAKHVVRVNPSRVVTSMDAVVHPVWLEMPGLSRKPSIVKSTKLKSAA